ncbi:uncharacterized protein LOC143179560 [Calliopsis andreniformis]|uniref:uncharacterized protein LOC143179560 n=1 Tax=Calliopsis andreniformis TaxID=337506 RepID=UPI003FCE71C5
MADDPNRDILPVKDDSFCAETCRSSIDPRERHLVYKLDRYELEDKYLRLLEEASNLKKLYNCQEDKIKRLATKLMRVTANPRACSVALDIYDDKKRLIALELENSKLKDKIAVLRNQLLSHTISSRSSSRSRNPQARPSSGRITCRSESSRTKVSSCHCIVRDINEDNERSSLVKIEELEAQKKEMASRILELEKELSLCAVTNQRGKVADNVEYIRVWRQMKQLNDKLIAAQNTNDSLNVQINDLKRKLEETTKDHREMSAALLAERKRASELDEEMLKARESQLSLREKDEQIQDLMNEMKILQQHNNELVALSSKYGKVELENMELKKKVTEQQHDQETLRTAVNTEQANIVALQSSNEQLMGKLQELQKNIDTLTVQLTSFQTQTEKQDSSKGTQMKQTGKKTPPKIDKDELYEDTATQVLRCMKCCGENETVLLAEDRVIVTRDIGKLMNSAVQTEYAIPLGSRNTKEQGTSVMSPVMTPVKEKETKEPIPQQNVEQAKAETPLTPEKMLKLLEQAQINTPVETSRFAHDVAISDYKGIMDLNQRHRQVVSLEKLLFGDSSSALHTWFIEINIVLPEEMSSDSVRILELPDSYGTRELNNKMLEFVQLKVCINITLRGLQKISAFCPSKHDVESHNRVPQEVPLFTSMRQQQMSDKNAKPDQPVDIQLTNFSKMLSFLFNIFRGCPPECSMPPEAINLYRPKPISEHQFTQDVNNNNIENGRVKNQHIVNHPLKTVILNENNKARGGCSTRRYCSNVYSRQRQEKLKRNIVSAHRRRNQATKFSNNENCTCDDLITCNFNSSCDGQCCGKDSVKPFAYEAPVTKTSQNIEHSLQNDLFKSNNQNCSKTAGTMYMTRLQNENSKGPYRSPESNRNSENNDSNNDNKALSELHEYLKQLDKCRELLDNSCSLNDSPEMPLKEIVDHAKNANRIRYRASKELRMLETRKIESFCSLNCPNECIDSASAISDSFPLVITDGQGLMELHIISLQLSTSAKQILFQENDIGNVSLYISWNIWNQESTSTPTLKCPKLNFNSSFVYRIPDLFSFFNYVLLEFVKFQVNVNRDTCDDYTVATGKLSIKDMLDYPQNKLHYIAPVNSVLPCSLGSNFGQLSLWVRLSCNIEKVEEFKQKRGLQLQTEGPGDSIVEFPEKSSVEAAVETTAEAVVESPVETPAEIPAEGSTEVEVTDRPTKRVGISSIEDDLLVLKDRSDELIVHEKSKDQLPQYESEPFVARISEASDEIGSGPQLSKHENDLKRRDTTDSDKSDNNSDQPGSQDTKQESKRKGILKTGDEKAPNSVQVRVLDVDEDEKDDEVQADNETSSVKEFNAVITDVRKEETADQGDSDESINDLSTVFSEKNWKEFKRRSFITFSKTAAEDGEHSNDTGAVTEEEHERDTIVIEIMNMVLYPKSSVMENKEIQLLYIEFSFLGYCGADMETISLRKPQPPNQKLTYNFRKKFRVDPLMHSVQDNILRSMLHDSGSPTIKFIVVCEPLPEDTDTKECVEVGYAHFNIREYALGDSDRVVSLPIYTPDETEQIGFLKISVTGADTIRERLATRDASSITFDVKYIGSKLHVRCECLTSFYISGYKSEIGKSKCKICVSFITVVSPLESKPVFSIFSLSSLFPRHTEN